VNAGPYIVQFAPSGQYWVEPPTGARNGGWCAHRHDATTYPRLADAERAAAGLRAKFQRHNRAGIKVLPLHQPPAPAFDPMRRHTSAADLTLPLNFGATR